MGGVVIGVEMWYNKGMEDIKQQLSTIIKDLYGLEVEPKVTVAPEGQRDERGRRVDYATNVAMRLAGKLKRKPQEIAAEMAEKISGFDTEVAGPGFLNFISSDEYFKKNLADLSEHFEENIACDEYRDKLVISEFSDPNPFKVLHVGHLYTSIVGEAVSKMIEFAGGDVRRANFGGDVGMHVAKTLYGLQNKLNTFSEDRVAGARLHEAGALGLASKLRTSSEKDLADSVPPAEIAELLAKCYVEGTRAYEDDSEAHQEIVKINKEIYDIAENDKHDTELAKLYWWGREASYAYFEDFYSSIGLKFDKYYPESTVAQRGLAVVKEQLKNGVYEDSDGAVVFKGEPYGLHTRVFINKEGLPTYEAKDVGLIHTKWDDYHFDYSLIITGNDIIDYMKVVLKSVEQYNPELPKRTIHLTHGNVKLAGGVKMSSRKGNFLKAVDVLKMVDDALAESRDGEGSKVVSFGATKYAFLKYKIGGNIVFSPEESVSMTGNSGPYLQYAAVRARKMLSSVGVSEGEANHSSSPSEKSRQDNWSLTEYERELVKKVMEYKGVLAEAVKELAPHKICAYLYELAQTFNRFYEHVKVVGSEYEAERLTLVSVYLATLTHGLGLLGIEVPESM